MLHDLIKALGGPAAIGREIGVTTSAVTNWASRGEISPTYVLAVWEMALRAGIKWIPAGAEQIRIMLASSAEREPDQINRSDKGA
jgi:hypothetical protein